jgi:PQQ enzyme repeat
MQFLYKSSLPADTSLALRCAACHLKEGYPTMTRALFCGALLLSLSCSSPDGPAGGAGGTAAVGTAGTTGQAGSTVAGAGVGGTSVASGGGTGVSGSTNTGGMGGTGTAGTAGNLGTAGTAGSLSTGGTGGGSGGSGGSGGTGTVESGGSVTQRGGDSARTSHWVAASLTKANMSKMALDSTFKANFAGEFASSPLFLPGATAGMGRFYVATTENDVYALDETTGATVWKHNIGGYLASAPVCSGKPDHHGILSTPVIDAAAGVIYVAAAMADKHHELHALAVGTGMELAGWPLNITQAVGSAFNSPVQNQRSALSLVNGIVYVAFGGYCGDAGNYKGWVVAVNSKDPSKRGSWATMDARQAGIWAPGGLASDGNGVFAVTGNYVSALGTDHSRSDSEEILRLTDLAVPHRDNANLFLPSEWSNPMNSSDKDFGASSPAVISVPNSTPSTVIVAPSKPGRVYFLDAANLGGEKGQFAEVVVAGTGDQSVYTAPSAYQAASGVHVAISTGVRSACPGGGDANVMSILMQPGVTPDKPPMPKISWCAKVSTGDTTMRSPISTNSAGSADPIVWMINGDKLNAFDGETGALLYDSGAGATPSSCSGVAKFTAPVAVNGHIVTGGSSGGQAHLCSWSVH